MDILEKLRRWSVSEANELEDDLHEAIAEIERLRAAAGGDQGGEELQAYRDAAQYDPMMEGPRFKGWDRSQLERARRITEAALAGGERGGEGIERVSWAIARAMWGERAELEAHHAKSCEDMARAAIQTMRAGGERGGGGWQEIDEVPPPDCDVLLAAWGGDKWCCDVGMVSADGIIWDWGWTFPATHWAPMPKPPGGVAGGEHKPDADERAYSTRF